MEQCIVHLHGGDGDPIPAHAEQKEADTTGGVQPMDELNGHFNGAYVAIGTPLGLFQANSIPETEDGRAELELVLCCGQGAGSVWRDFCDLPSCKKIDEGTFPPLLCPRITRRGDDSRDMAHWEGVFGNELAHESLAVIVTS
jgi:hypothetical protein